MKNNIQRCAQLRQMPLHSRSHPASNPVPFYCPAQHLSNRKPYAWANQVLTPAVKDGNVPREMPSAFMVNRLKVCPLEQP
jgi:hypothetical protein